MEEKAKWWQSLSHLNTIIPLTSIPLKHVGCHRTLWKHLNAFKSFAPKIPYEFLFLSLSLSLWDLSPKCWISIGFDTWPASPVPFRKQQTHLLGPIPWQIEKVKGVTPWCFLPNEINLVDHRPAGFWQKDPVVVFFKGMCEKDQANLKIYSKSTPKMPDFKGQ